MPKKQPSQPAAAPQASPTTAIDCKSQQRLLDVYAAAFADVLSRDNFSDLLQEIKQALYNRDFATAFGKTEYLEAYAARWSPTRSLGYASVFKGLEGHIRRAVQVESQEPEESQESDPRYPDSISSRLRMLCIGGCAAEHVAFASVLDTWSLQGTLILLDVAPWPSISQKLQYHLTTPPVLSPYASAAAKASNHAFLPSSQLSLQVEQNDVLSLPKDKLARLTGNTPIVVTLLFTLNELYTESGIGKTTTFLGLLGEALASESLLLVVDSPGSYSEAAVGKEKKRYPMHWLLDHTLLQKCPPGVLWEKLESEDSVWFRLPEGLSYPIPLENMRYQLHLYRLSKQARSNE
jgi:25S rRNA (uracil2843-N3)-methyltransferase